MNLWGITPKKLFQRGNQAKTIQKLAISTTFEHNVRLSQTKIWSNHLNKRNKAVFPKNVRRQFCGGREGKS